MTNSKPWVLGLTGGIASGKTTVSDYLASKGCLVADADAESRSLTAPGGAAMPEIERIFGADFIRPDGAMDRAKMRELVFANDAARRTLESIIHPLVRKALMEKIRTGAENSPYAVIAIPLFPSILQLRPILSRLLVIDCPMPLQCERLRSRSGLSREEPLAIIRAQSRRWERIEEADDVIVNAGSLPELLSAADTLHQRYLRAAEAA